MLSVPASVLYNMCSGAVRATGDSVTPFRILAACGVVNVALDTFFLIVIPLGVAGVAWATLISQLLSVVLIIISLRRKDGVLYLRLSGIAIDLFTLKNVLHIGLPTGIQTVLITVSNICVLRVALLAVLSVTPGTVRAVAAVYPMTWGGAAVCFIAAFLWIIGKKLKTQ